ncbi:MAG: RtcB family protein [Promethearchaeota archaeon]
MKQVISTEKLPIKLWLDDIEDGALEQAKNIANLPFAYKWIAIMPDSHQGYGMPIGGVLATKGVIIPNAVGVDIGCGMCAYKTHLKTDDINTELIKTWMKEIREAIPVGFDHHKEKQDGKLMPSSLGAHMHMVVIKEYDNALYQIGTLGGGNHFIEIQKDKDNNIWVMLHSGSRNFGFKVAKYYNSLAIKLNERWFSKVDKKQELAFLPIETQEAKDYMFEMQYCVDFALANRKLMMEWISGIIGSPIKDMINIAHNYAKFENHFGTNVLIHRKGATLASDSTIGIIPGSQGSKSYIVKGLGNPDSFNSCSHGAGRKMGRKQATRELDLANEIARLDEQGIIHGIRHQNDLDEATGAYKDIDIVMANQDDLVSIEVELTPLAVIKG